MDKDFALRISSHPKYRELEAKRSRFAWLLTALMMIVYYGFIVLVAFDKALLSKPIGNGVMTLGMPIGLGVIIFTIVITGLYVRRANTEFDALTEELARGVSA